MDDSASSNLIINYLPQTMTDDEFYSLFSAVGQLNSSKIVRDKGTGYSYGFGFVDYRNPVDAQRAIDKLNGYQVMNKRLKVAYSRKGEDIKGANLYVRNLPSDYGEEELQNLFGGYGNVIQVRILRNPVTKESKGVGFILFSKKPEAEQAMKDLNGQTPPGSSQGLVIKFADDNAKKVRAPPGQAFTTNFARATTGAYGGRFMGAAGGGPMRNMGGSRFNRYNPMGGMGQGPMGGMGMDADMMGMGDPGYDMGDYSGMAPMSSFSVENGGFIVFVYNIGTDAKESDLWRLFSPYGTIYKVDIIMDKEKNQCKGYGFVTMPHDMEAANAISCLNGYMHKGKKLMVSFKKGK